MGVVSAFVRLLKWSCFIGFFVFIIHWWITTKTFMFSDKEIERIALKHLGKDIDVSTKLIHGELMNKYPGHILPAKDLQWIYVNAGGWMGSMCLLHASLTEYVLLFGTALNTEGHSGRYWANITDTILTGEFKQWTEGSTKFTLHKPGDTVVHAWGEATSVNFAEGTWMLEYGRGFIPSTMGFALADTIFSTQDFLTMYYTFRIYTKAMALEASNYIVHLQDYVK